MTSRRGWKRPFDEPIPLPRGREIVTLEDAGNYISSLPKAEQLLEEWQAAVAALLLVVELNGWVPFRMLRERIPMLSAMTLDQLGARMKCYKCGRRPERYYPANQSDTPGFVRSF